MGSICINFNNKPHEEIISFKEILTLIEDEEKEIIQLLPIRNLLVLIFLTAIRTQRKI